MAQATVTSLSWGKLIAQGIAQAVGVFAISLFLFWLWVPILGAIYTGMGGLMLMHKHLPGFPT
jgi:hypothetical protein